MINNIGGNDGGQIPGQQLAQVSAKEFGAKFKSKRGKCLRHEVKCSQAAREPVFSDGFPQWHVSPGLNLFRREASDLISFLFRSECYTFLASEGDYYLPPYGKSTDQAVNDSSMALAWAIHPV